MPEHTHTHSHAHRSWCVHCWKGLTYCTTRVTLSSHINYRNHTQSREIFSGFMLENGTGINHSYGERSVPYSSGLLLWQKKNLRYHLSVCHSNTTSVNLNSCAYCCGVFYSPSWHSAPVIQSSMCLSLLCLFFSWNAFTCPFRFLQL